MAKHPLYDRDLPPGWRLLTVDSIKSPQPSSCVAGPFGSNISSKYFVDEGVPIIRGNNLRDDLTRFVPEGFAFVSPDRALAYKAQHVRAGDLVFTCWGTIGQVGLIPPNGPFEEYIISNKQLKLRPDSRLCDPEYLFYFFANASMVQHIKNRAIGAAVPGINLGILKALPVVLPPLDVQKRIAGILSAYDNLIENNERRIRLLEDIAGSLYREWFVHFRFPGREATEFMDAADGRIPAAWRPIPLSEVTEYISRGISPKYDNNGTGLVINQKCIRDRKLSVEPARRHNSKVPDEKYVRRGDVLINSTGVGTLGRVAQVLVEIPSCTVDTHVTIVRPRRDGDGMFFGMMLLEQQGRIEGMGVGATGQTELARTRISSMDILLPPTSLQQHFGQLVSPMRERIVLLDAENTNLRRQRDLLLPRLLSGEIDISSLPAPTA